MLTFSSTCHQGNVRDRNEDAVLENDTLGLWVVADGVGGNGHGDIASQIATQTIDRKVRQGAPLVDAIQAANQAILQAIEENPDYAGMATTVVACHLVGAHYEIAWVGDSRAYLVSEGDITQISNDHNVANALYLQGKISQQELPEHEGQHELTQALGQLSLDKIPLIIGELHDGDCLLLCTDGLCGVLKDSDIMQVIAGAENVEDAKQRLLEGVLDAGAPDNVSFSLLYFRADHPGINKHDFASSKSLRAPFNREPYQEHRQYRPTLLFIILVSIVALLFII